MARTIPAPANVALPDPRLAVPRRAILAGSASLDGHQRSFAEGLNLAFATSQADTAWSQGCADGQFVVNDAVVTERYRVRVPKVSDVHTDLLVSLHAFSHGAGTGVVTFTCVGNGNTAAPVLGGALALTARATLDCTGGFVADADGDYVEITVSTKNPCTIRAVYAQWADLAPGALYPGADDALAAGPVGDFVPADTDEVAADQPASADWLAHRRASLAQVRGRIKNFACWAGVQNSATASLYQWPAPMRYPVLAPIIAGTDQGLNTLTLWARGVFTAASGELGVQVIDFFSGRVLGEVSFAASSGTTWSKATVRLREQRSIGDVPADYPGLMLLGLNFVGQLPYLPGRQGYFPTYDATRCIDSVSLWGR